MDWLKAPIKPMLAELTKEIPTGDYLYEVKWDGVRAILVINEGDISIYTRNQNNVTAQFPELEDPPFDITNGVFDCEIICPDEEGKPSFSRIIKRVRTTNKMSIKRLAESHPVQCYLFDCLYLDDNEFIKKPLWSRRKQLSEVLDPNDQYKLSETFEDGERLFQAAKEQELEGILAKQIDSRYIPGKRSSSWKKIKVRHYIDCKVIGYSRGEADRSGTFGALHVAEIDNGDLIYRGKVGTGFSYQGMKETRSLLDMLDKADRPEFAPRSKGTVWVKPFITAEISYNELNPNGTFRAPVFERFKLEPNI